METGNIMVSWQEFFTELQGGLAMLQSGLISSLFEPWGQIQILLILVLIVASQFAGRFVQPRFEAWVRAQETTRQRLRFFALALRHTRLILFTLSIWATLGIMRAVTWQSRSYLIGIAASIAAIWLAVALISRLVRNPIAARILTFSVVAIATIQAFGLMPTTIAILDAAALSAGDFRVSLLTLTRAAIIISVLFPLANVTSNFLDDRIQNLGDLSPSMRVLTGKVLRIGLLVIVSIFGLQSLGLDLTTLTVFSGAIGLGLGFGLQKVVSNLISGVILLLDRSVKPGDVIEVEDTFGSINKLGSRFVSVVTRDGREYLIPNEDLITNQVINWSYSDTRVRLEVSFGVSYDSDPLEVRKLAIEAAKEPKRVLAVPSPVCHLVAYGESSVDYVLRFWVSDPSVGVVNIRSEVLIALWYALKANDISIPYARREVTLTEPIKIDMVESQPPARSKPSRARPKKAGPKS